jgi:hypothetical protein
MHNVTLDALLGDAADRQFWLKPVGPPKDHPDWAAPEHRTWTQRDIEVHFAKSPARIAAGAVIIAYRIRIQKLIYVATRLPREEWGPAETRPEWSRRRWPHLIKARNLTPEYGSVWDRHQLQPFALAREYNELDPDQPARLGSILRGNDKTSLPRPFAEFLIRRIRELT